MQFNLSFDLILFTLFEDLFGSNFYSSVSHTKDMKVARPLLFAGRVPTFLPVLKSGFSCQRLLSLHYYGTRRRRGGSDEMETVFAARRHILRQYLFHTMVSSTLLTFYDTDGMYCWHKILH